MSATTPHRRRTAVAAAGVLAALLMAAFASPSDATRSASRQDDEAPLPELSLNDWPMSASAARGKKVYAENCVGCHGPEGLGNGPAAAFLNPLPRNFQAGRFKFRSTEPGNLPTEDDLFRTVTYGLPGSSMPGFPLVNEGKRRDVVAYVLHLTTFGSGKDLARRTMLKEEIGIAEAKKRIPDFVAEVKKTFLDARKLVVVPPEPAATPEILAKGKTLFIKSCAACHGDTGRGDGSSSFALRDWQDAEIRARDFTSGVYRSGNTARDVFMRLRTGIAGTPMPAFSDPDDDLWAIVHYVQSLKRPGAIPLTRRMGRDPGAEK
jgi:cytochrome c oxidase cbb3-type subunit I/II